jgi:ArsR family metal-binding transcriptional regulator
LSTDSFISQPEIVRIVPCLADPSKIRFTALFDKDVSESFPYLNALLPGAIYNHAGKTITLHREGRLLSIYPTRVEAAKVDHKEDAEAIIGWITKLINSSFQNRNTITPIYKRRDRLTVLDVIKLLPGTNCRCCGLHTCLAFAALLAAERTSILNCRDIFLVDYTAKRKELISLLLASGYSVPEAFA